MTSRAATEVLVVFGKDGHIAVLYDSLGSSSPHRHTDTSFHPVPETATHATVPVAITTLNSSSEWIGTSIYLQPTSSGSSMAMAGSAPNGIPSSLPQVVSPVAGFPDAPIGYTLIQVGFSYGLNYEFVVANSLSSSLSSAQIFTYLPQGISYGIGVDGSNVIMHSLMPYDTTKSLGYVTTLALAYIPSNAVANLAIIIHVPLSRLYSNPSSPVSTIMSHINPAISIKVSQDMKSSNSSIASEGSTLPATVSNENQPPVGKMATAGIAAGAVVAVAVCGGAVLFILRRYKSRLSSSKIVHSANANLNKEALMSGGQQPRRGTPISGPMVPRESRSRMY
ncbi:hypothetical protein VE03_10679 [Pseudogymnoascus sp. 23342-1-I1]|nr:hypothetical protein VE03_10679 [Pseudogymnoascus sp. 23342-1-I1]